MNKPLLPPSPNAFEPAMHPQTLRAIQRKVSQLVCNPVFRGEDRDDLEQELIAHVIRCVKHYDPTIGPFYPYIVTVIDRHARNLTRKRKANKRSAGLRLASLNVDVKSEDGGHRELGQLMDVQDGDRRLARERRFTDEQLADLRQDLESVIARLPEPWRQLLEHSKSLTLTEVSQVMQIPRSTLAHWMKQIQERFVEVGLDKYLQK